MTTVQQAIEKIDEQIEIAQVCRIEASKVNDATSMERHHGKKVALVFMRQELVNLLVMEKQQLIDFSYKISNDLAYGSKKVIEEMYNETFKSEYYSCI